MTIRLHVGTRTLTATVANNQTARDFVSLLPLTLAMKDLLRREKFAHLPRALSERGPRTSTYEVGDIIYWSPGPDVAVYYRHDGKDIPAPGIILLGKIAAGIDALKTPGAVNVTIEPVVTSKHDAAR